MTVDEPDNAADARQAGGCDWLEVEDIDPDTGELLGTRWQRIGADGAPIDDPFLCRVETYAGQAGAIGGPATAAIANRRCRAVDQPARPGDTPSELADGSASVPAEELRRLIADTLGPTSSGGDEVLFSRAAFRSVALIS